MEERRKHKRYPIALLAQYQKDREQGLCALVDVNQEGTRIKFHSDQAWDVDTPVLLEINFPARPEPIAALFTLKWVQELAGEKTFNFIAGGMLKLKKSADNKIFENYLATIYKAVYPDEE
ncbi:PilZ domain-containing protein [Thermodesulfobacteriota bacterium]